MALLNLSSWCLMIVERLFLAVPQGFLQFVIVVFPDHTHLLFLLMFVQVFIWGVLLESKRNSTHRELNDLEISE